MKDSTQINLQGHFRIDCIGADGNLKWCEEINNLIMNGGYDFMSDVLFKDAQPSEMNQIAIGSGATAAAASQTAMITELARATAVYAHVAGTKVATLTVTFAAGTGTGTVREVGVLNAASNGVMLSRALLGTARAKAATDSLQVTYTFTLSQQ